jgi:hypothetical protein
MIKNFENFVNEGFLDNVINGIDAGIGAFKANRNAEKAADEDLKAILNGSSEVASDKTKMHVLIKNLVQKAAWFADGFSWDDITVDTGGLQDAELKVYKIEQMENILSEMKTILKENFEIK